MSGDDQNSRMVLLEEFAVTVQCRRDVADAEADQIRTAALLSLLRWVADTNAEAQQQFVVTVEQ